MPLVPQQTLKAPPPHHRQCQVAAAEDFFKFTKQVRPPPPQLSAPASFPSHSPLQQGLPLGAKNGDPPTAAIVPCYRRSRGYSRAAPAPLHWAALVSGSIRLGQG